ncbi:MAG: tetratricopeptide repeat protein [bacterium]
MMGQLLLSIGLVWLLFPGSGGVMGQTTSEEPTPRPVFQADPFEEAAFRDKLRAAQDLLRRQNYPAAADLLESLFSEQPDNDVVANQLRNCYDRLKAYDKLHWLALQRLELYPDRLDSHLELARVLVIEQRFDEAQQSYRQALKLALQDQEMEAVLSGMIDAGFEIEASHLIDSLVPLSERPIPLLLQRGIILEHQKKYGRAAVEYLNIIGDTSRPATTAERRLLDLLKFEASSEEVEEALLDQADSLTSLRGLRLLVDHYLVKGRFDAAFEISLREDSLVRGQGRSLVRLMSACRDRRLYEQSIRVGWFILANYPASPILTQTHITLGDLLTKIGEYDSALVVYDATLGWLTQDRDKADALYSMGMIYLEYLDDPQTALTYFDSVTVHFPKGIGYLRALIRRPHCHLRLGDLVTADSLFGSLATNRLTEDFKEEIDYYRGLIRFCRCDFDSAKVALQKLIVTYPRGFYVNDALRLQLAMDRAQASPTLLGAYATAVLYATRHMTDSTLTALESVVNHDDKALADLALYRSLEIYQDLADTVAVLAQVQRLSTEFPESYYTPYGLKIKADILIESSAGQSEARDIYRQLLESHPNYPFAGDIRQRLRALGGDA